MDIYQETMNYLSTLPLIDVWPEILALFTRSASRKPRHWRLPIVATEAVGGDLNHVIPAITAIGCLHISILLVDDMLDADPRGEHHRLGKSVTANMAAAFQAVGLEAIAHSNASPFSKLAALISLNQMMWTTTLGQYLDVQIPEDEGSYWYLVKMKSSPFFGAALQVGALMTEPSDETQAEQIKQIGHLYGEMIQIHDDLSDTLSTPANSDWTLGRMPLPILYASCVNHPERERFMQLRDAIVDPNALAEAQNILIRSGAVSYCLDQLLQKSKNARGILTASKLIYQEGIDGLLDEIIDPVKRLFSVTGIVERDALLEFFPFS